VLPVEVRRHLGVTAGDELTLELDGDIVRIRSFRQAVREAQSLYRTATAKRQKSDPVQVLLELRADEFWGE
jgi:bifunctional DNA-binding transcriptional regulator/antitoxin component of YhaV-PrlF toxin-antitoxin module